MSRAYSINVRVNRQEKCLIENNAKANGHKYISEYIRIRSLCFNPFEQKINEIHKKLLEEIKSGTNMNEADRKLLEFI